MGQDDQGLQDQGSTPLPTEQLVEHRYAVELNPRLRLIVPLVVAMGFALEALDTTIITTMVPVMAKSLNTSPAILGAAISVYALALALLVPVSGWMSDNFGSKRVFIAALAIFTLGSAACGFAENLLTLVIARALQGVGGAMMTPVGRLMLLRSFPRHELGVAINYMSIPLLIGPLVGPVLGGYFATYLSWRWAFFINIPFGLFGMIVAAFFIGELEQRSRSKFDVVGFFLLATGIGLLQLCLHLVEAGIESAMTALAGAAAISTLVAFGFHAKARGPDRSVVNWAVFRDKAFLIGSLAGGLARTGISATPFLLPLLLQTGFGFSAAQSGLVTFITAAGALVANRALSPVLRVCGFRTTLTTLCLLCSASTIAFVAIEKSTPYLVIYVATLLFGLVRAFQFMGSSMLAYADLSPERLSAGTSVGAMVQQLSVAFGVSIAAFLITVFAPGQAVTIGSIHAAFLIMGLLPLAAAPFFLMLSAQAGVAVSGGGRGAGGKTG